MSTNSGHVVHCSRLSYSSIRSLLRRGWPVIVLLGLLWFPFDWLSTVWPFFGAPFREVFHNAHDHFIGHTVFFLVVGGLGLFYVPSLRHRLQWYVPALVMAALVQETIQAFFRGELPTFTDFNAFKGDALGGMSAYILWFVSARVRTWITTRGLTTPSPTGTDA